MGQALLAGASIIVVWMLLYFQFFRRTPSWQLKKIKDEPCLTSRENWEAHVSGSLEDANLGLNADVAFVGLIVFSVFETLSGLGQMKAGVISRRPGQQYGPTAYVGLMMVTCLMGMVGFADSRCDR